MLTTLGCAPRDAYEAAEQFSDLHVPYTAQVADFGDVTSGLFIKDLLLRVELQFDAAAFANVEAEARRRSPRASRRVSVSSGCSDPVN